MFSNNTAPLIIKKQFNFKKEILCEGHAQGFVELCNQGAQKKALSFE